MRVVLTTVAMLVAGSIQGVAQVAWSGIAMPYERALIAHEGPSFSFTTDLVAEAADLPRLRSVTLPDGMSELRLWVGFGIAIPHLLLRLTTQGDDVRGEFVRWWGMVDHPSKDPRYDDFLAAQRTLAGAFGCNAVQNGGEWAAMRDGIPNPHEGWTLACRADFGDEEPDWADVFARLSALGVSVLPDPDSLTPEPVPVMDGTALEVEILCGAEYRTYTYNNPDYQPWPQAAAAQAIIAIIYELQR